LLDIGDVPPPTGLWTRIDWATATAPFANDNRAVRRWQFATAAAVVLAVLTAGLTMREAPKLPAPTAVAPLPAGVQSVAALSETGGTPALLVTYDAVSGKMRVMPVNVAPRPGHSLELWVIAGKTPPKSIGLMPAKGAAAIPGLTLDKLNEMTIAVSLEPKGGSPTGQPTGPVLYSGQMVSMPVS
jgi:anti-sigma-K factor RskA